MICRTFTELALSVLGYAYDPTRLTICIVNVHGEQVVLLNPSGVEDWSITAYNLARMSLSHGRDTVDFTTNRECNADDPLDGWRLFGPSRTIATPNLSTSHESWFTKEPGGAPIRQLCDEAPLIGAIGVTQDGKGNHSVIEQARRLVPIMTESDASSDLMRV